MQSEKKKDAFYAKIAFYLSLGFWIPLFNIGLCTASIIISIMAIKNQFNEPEKYGGLSYAIIALVLSILGFAGTVIFYIIYLNSSNICGSEICRIYYNGLSQ